MPKRLNEDEAWDKFFTALSRAMRRVPKREAVAVRKAIAAFDGMALSEFQLDLLESATPRN